MNNTTIAFKVSPQVARKLRLYAARRKMSTSELLRRWISKKLKMLEEKGKLNSSAK